MKQRKHKNQRMIYVIDPKCDALSVCPPFSPRSLQIIIVKVCVKWRQLAVSSLRIFFVQQKNENSFYSSHISRNKEICSVESSISVRRRTQLRIVLLWKRRRNQRMRMIRPPRSKTSKIFSYVFFNPHSYSHLFNKISKFIKCKKIVALYI